VASAADRSGRPQDALQAIDAALQLAPNEGRLLRRAGFLRIAHGPIEQAAELLSRAYAIEPTAELRRTLADLHRRTARRMLETGGDARSWFARLLELDPSDLDSTFEYAKLLEADGRGVDAWTLAGRVLEQDPTHPGAALFVGEKFAQAGHHQRALAIVEPATKKHPNEAALFELLSNAWSKQNGFAQAAAAYQRVIDIRRGDTTSFRTLGQLHEQAEQYEPAWRAYHQAFALDGKDVETIRRLAGVTDALGRTPEAIEWWKLAVSMAPRDAKARYELARCHLRLQQRNEAIAEYEHVRQLDVELATRLYHALGGQ
jgi:tetratricopeptide (TPR) repeat protein